MYPFARRNLVGFHSNEKRKIQVALKKCSECRAEVNASVWGCHEGGYKAQKLKRSTFGRIIKWSFIALNLLMACWLITSLGVSPGDMDNMSDSEKLSSIIGAYLRGILIILVWVVGYIALGLFFIFTHPHKG